MFEIGDIVDDRWEVVGPLDTGSMSVVLCGRAVADGHAVAIKVMKPDVARDPIAVQRCVREARVTQGLTHPNIVRVEGTGIASDGRPYIIMELLVGETLEVCVGRGRLDPDRAAAVIVQVAAAIDAAHAAGIVHRDLKPDNVFLLDAAEGEVRIKILDFGFARLMVTTEGPDGFRTESNALLGTPLYMAPEQIRDSRNADFRADLWSLGVMAYELLVGAAPFASRSVVDLFIEILSAPITAPSSRVAGLPETLDGWVVRALDRSPQRRFQSGKELADALTAALQGIPAQPAPSVGTRTDPPPRSPRWMLWVAIVLVVAAVTALTGVLVGSHGTPGRAPLAPAARP